MSSLIAVVLSVLAAMVLVPAVVLFVEVVASTLLRRREHESSIDAVARPRVAVLVPAHDEAGGIAAALATITPQLAAGDRLVVVADNCSDDTAARAANAGAEVIERHDTTRRGKGYALDAGIRHLEAAPPDVVLMVDADCELHPNALASLATECVRIARPTQALYLMRSHAGAGIGTRIAEFAWVVKNQVRPLGGRRLGMPCSLMGTGMAFPWQLIRSAPLASGHIVEDMRLGLDLAAAGTAPRFHPQALVTSFFPSDRNGTATQRARWERGHVDMLLKEGPRALRQAIAQRRPALAVMLLDIAVPPLALLALLLVGTLLLAMLGSVVTGFALPLVLALVAMALFGASVAIAWARFARHVVSLHELAAVPLYVLGKLPLYARMFKRGPTEWVRTRRDERE